MSILPSMMAFALAASISPGPVNLVALGAGARYGFGASMRHVTGATFGFTLLLVLTGLGLRELLSHLPYLTRTIEWAGVAFLLYMAYRLASDDGTLPSTEAPSAAMGVATSVATKGPSVISGAAMQWLNPKAWLAALAGMGAYAADGDSVRVWQFTVVYFVICYASIACWAYAGSFLRQYLYEPRRVRFFNRLMAVLLVGSAAYLVGT